MSTLSSLKGFRMIRLNKISQIYFNRYRTLIFNYYNNKKLVSYCVKNFEKGQTICCLRDGGVGYLGDKFLQNHTNLYNWISNIENK